MNTPLDTITHISTTPMRAHTGDLESEPVKWWLPEFF